MVRRCAMTSVRKRVRRAPVSSVEKVFGAERISRTRVATCAANAPTNPSTSSQSSSVSIRAAQLLSAAMSAGTTSKRSPTMP